MRFDLLIKGGEIVDRAAGYFGPGGVAVGATGLPWWRATYRPAQRSA